MTDRDPMSPDQRLATTDQAAYELYGGPSRAEQVDRGDGSVLQAGRVFIPVALAERATQTSIEILLPADRMNGVHLAPGKTHERRDWMPALVRYTGVGPEPVTAFKLPAGVPIVITDEQITEHEQDYGKPLYADPPVEQQGEYGDDVLAADEDPYAGIDASRLGRPKAPYPTTQDALHSAENPLDDERLEWWASRMYDAMEFARYTVDFTEEQFRNMGRRGDEAGGWDHQSPTLETMKAFVTEVRGTLGGS